MLSQIYVGCHVKCSLFLSSFNETWIFSSDFRNKAQIPNFMKIGSVGAELFHADKQTRRSKLVAFRSSTNAPKNATRPNRGL
jgi:hypothetical protein